MTESILCNAIRWPLFSYLHHNSLSLIIILVHQTQLLEHWSHETNNMLCYYRFRLRYSSAQLIYMVTIFIRFQFIVWRRLYLKRFLQLRFSFSFNRICYWFIKCTRHFSKIGDKWSHSQKVVCINISLVTTCSFNSDCSKGRTFQGPLHYISKFLLFKFIDRHSHVLKTASYSVP